ncbi:Lrp/AsnC family transcriptional regulator [Arenibaculum pallidiluteum]|uniref:Lrp/AsnC family transcriptional regulator n=1 Tax=Arenibaculum pallidiluteum TaxID=2812559 RepID=UPI001A95850F|nr:Lrp/AsnC family transcriptional regulator [Arenibaculum pallidiluteum]
MVQLDSYDIRLLSALQEEARLSNVALSERVHLSASQVHRRLRRLEEEGVIAQYRAQLDPDLIGLGVLAFTSVSLERHGESPAQAFAQAVARLPEVLECFSVTGEADYVLRIVARDLKAFSEFLMHAVMPIPGVRSVRSNIVLETVKQTTVLPLGQAEVR